MADATSGLQSDPLPLSCCCGVDTPLLPPLLQRCCWSLPPPSDVPHFLCVVALAGGFIAAIQPFTPPLLPPVCPAGSTDLGSSSDVPMLACVVLAGLAQRQGVVSWLKAAVDGTARG